MTTEVRTTPCKPLIQQPSKYKVIFIDDDITTFSFVIDILVSYFNKNEDDAYELTMQTHLTGSCVAGIYSKDTAETKVSLANAELIKSHYPLNILLAKSI